MLSVLTNWMMRALLDLLVSGECTSASPINTSSSSLDSFLLECLSSVSKTGDGAAWPSNGPEEIMDMGLRDMTLQLTKAAAQIISPSMMAHSTGALETLSSQVSGGAGTMSGDHSAPSTNSEMSSEYVPSPPAVFGSISFPSEPGICPFSLKDLVAFGRELCQGRRHDRPV